MADDGDDNVVPFPRIGFIPPGGAGSGPAFPGPFDGVPEPPAQHEAESAGPPARRSPLDTLAGLPAPVPPLPTGAPMPSADAPEGAAAGGMLPHGFVPEALRGPGGVDTSEMESAGIGALSMAAVLAVAVAALRGIHTAVSNHRATREQRQAVADATRRGSRTSNGSAGTGGTGAGRGSGGGGRRNIPSSQEWARRTLGRTGRSGNAGGTSPNRRSNTRGPDSKSTGNRNDPPGRRRNTGPNGPKKPGGLFSRNTSGTESPGGGRGDRKDRDRARRERMGGVHKTTQSGDTGSRLRLRRRGKTGSDTTGAATRGTGGKGRGGRTKSPTGTSGPKGTLRPPKDSPRRNGRAKLDMNTSGPKNKAAGTGKPAKLTKAGKAGGPQRRTTLTEAISAEAERRLRKRRKHMTPAVSVAKKHKRKDKSRPGKTGTTSTSAPTSTGPTTPKAGKMKWKRGRKGPAKPSRPTSAWDGARRRIRDRWTKRRSTWPDGGTYTAGPSGGRRRSPFEAAGMATGAAYGTTYTVERADNPGDQEHRWEPKPPKARPAAGALPPPRPAAAATPEAGPAAAPTSTKGAGMSLPANTPPGFNLAPSMSAEHTTEITLDDTLDVLEKLTGESFGAHDESVRLAAKTKQLRDALEDLAIDLLSRHNILGQLTGAAMARLAESMEVLSRKADEMAVSSLAAAELSEAAEQAMFDAYKPVQQATADAGLAVPSARVHNEG